MAQMFMFTPPAIPPFSGSAELAELEREGVADVLLSDRTSCVVI